MPLNPLTFDNDYFTKIQNRNGFIKAGDFDSQFTTIGSYINKFIVSTLDQLIDSLTPGINNPADANKNLINVGDGNTKWDFPKAEYIPESSLSLTKLLQANIGSILATDSNQIFRAVSPASGGLALTSRIDNTPIWKQIRGTDSISNRVITSDKIALGGLRSENFGISFERTYIRRIIQNQQVALNTISSSKIAPQAIGVNQLTNNMLAMLRGSNTTAVRLWGNTLPDNFIKNVQHIRYTNVSPVDHTKITPDFGIFPSLYSASNGYKAFTAPNIANGAITARNIKNNSLDGNRIFYYRTASVRPTGQMLAKGCIGIENLPLDYKNKLGL